jgi:hypothetical protein
VQNGAESVALDLSLTASENFFAQLDLREGVAVTMKTIPCSGSHHKMPDRGWLLFEDAQTCGVIRGIPKRLRFNERSSVV